MAQLKALQAIVKPSAIPKIDEAGNPYKVPQVELPASISAVDAGALSGTLQSPMSNGKKLLIAGGILFFGSTIFLMLKRRK